MRGLVLIGEGQGETGALPVLVRKCLEERDPNHTLLLDGNVIRFKASRVLRSDKTTCQPDFAEWVKAVTIGARRGQTAAILAVYDGDLPTFPPGAHSPFCAALVARALAAAAKVAGAGTLFSLAVVFACVEYEAWLVAGIESLAGRRLPDGRMAAPSGINFPSGHPESHGKRWLEQVCPGYRPTRDQRTFTELLDLNCVRRKNLRSFQRFEHALDQLVAAVNSRSPISTPG